MAAQIDRSQYKGGYRAPYTHGETCLAISTSLEKGPGPCLGHQTLKRIPFPWRRREPNVRLPSTTCILDINLNEPQTSKLKGLQFETSCGVPLLEVPFSFEHGGFEGCLG
jgi:hypothetical protein